MAVKFKFAMKNIERTMRKRPREGKKSLVGLELATTGFRVKSAKRQAKETSCG